MKTLSILALASVVILNLSGCADSAADEFAAADPAPAAVYKAGYGVQLTATAREFLDFETDDVVVHTVDDAADVPAVPVGALLRTARGDFVYVVNGDWFLRTPVAVGAASPTHVEISEGLYEGDIVVVKGVRALALSEIQALNGGVGCADGH